MIMADPSGAVDPNRYHPQSNIRKYLAATPESAPAPQLLGAAVHERWSVKTGCDADAQGLAGQAPTATTIAELVALPVPAFLPPDGRSDGAEKTVWKLTATLQAFGREADGDYHMVLADDQGHTMIAEIPDPGDIIGDSYFEEQIASARTSFDNHFRITESFGSPAASDARARSAESEFRETAVPITLTGLGFFDFSHGQRGVAPNAIELHPVIDIVFG